MYNPQKKITLFLKLPPPLTGATLINSYIADSPLVKDHFSIKLIPISFKTNIEDVSIFSFYKIKTIFHLYIKLIANFIRFKPDLVYFQISPLGWAFYRDCTFVFIMKLFGKHIVYHMHGKGIGEYVSKSLFRKKIYTWAFKNSSVICLSESLESDITTIYPKKPYIVNNAILVIPSGSRIHEKEKDTIHILFLSNLIVSKGIFVFLDALTLLNTNLLPKIKVSIVGKETEINGKIVESEIEKRNLSPFVHYLGPKYDEEKNEIYQNSDILVYPTLNDVWGLVILEAMQFGIPVIASREGAIPEIVEDGTTGFLVDKLKPEQIAEKLEILINDSDLRQKMGQVGRVKFLEKYTLEIFEKNMVNVFNDVLNNLSTTK